MSTVVWCLFDSGNGSYSKCLTRLNRNKTLDTEFYAVGLDKTGRNTHFIELNLADYSRLFNEDNLFARLDKLPRPDVIIASPPCESWSVASAMRGDACWKRETVDSLFEPQTPLTRFSIRARRDYDNVQFKYDKSFLNRINGELCAYNTVEIIKRYKPHVFVIENPLTSRLWEYVEKIQGFRLPFLNKVFYSNYDYPIAKPTIFASNIALSLNDTPTSTGVGMRDWTKDYNLRSDIPQVLCEQIFVTIHTFLSQHKETINSRQVMRASTSKENEYEKQW